VRDDAVVVVRVARGGIERLVPSLRSTDEIRAPGAAPDRLLDNLNCEVVPFLHRLLAEVAQRLIIHGKAAIESRRRLVTTVGSDRHEALLQRVLKVCRLQGEGSESSDERAVVAAAAHL